MPICLNQSYSVHQNTFSKLVEDRNLENNWIWPQLNVKEAMRGVAKNDRPVCVVDMGVYTGFEFVTFPFCR